LHPLVACTQQHCARFGLLACGNTGIGVTCWPAPEVTANENNTMGNLGLSAVEEADIVDFLNTLTDGYTP
jgi:hypothetical protein